MNLILIPFFIITMIGDMVGRVKNNLKLVAICQPLTTTFALLTAGASLFKEYHMTYTIWIMFGLLISVVADSILVSRTDKTAFIKGMALFFFTVITYGITWTRLSGFKSEDIMISVIMSIVYLIMAFIFMKGRDGVDGKPTTVVTIGVLIYMFNFCFVISRAISTFYGDYFTLTQSILFTLGIVLFFAGDLQLGIYHFIEKKFPMVQAPPFYFTGQLLIALSCSYF